MVLESNVHKQYCLAIYTALCCRLQGICKKKENVFYFGFAKKYTPTAKAYSSMNSSTGKTDGKDRGNVHILIPSIFFKAFIVHFFSLASSSAIYLTLLLFLEEPQAITSDHLRTFHS